MRKAIKLKKIMALICVLAVLFTLIPITNLEAEDIEDNVKVEQELNLVEETLEVEEIFNEVEEGGEESESQVLEDSINTANWKFRLMEELAENNPEKEESIFSTNELGGELLTPFKMARGLLDGTVNLTVGGEYYYGSWFTNWFTAEGRAAYCLEPAVYTPSEGSYNVDRYLDNSSLLAKATYYLYGGPGYDHYVNAVGYVGNGEIEAEAAMTHVELSYIYNPNGNAFAGLSAELIEALKYQIGYLTDYPDVFPNPPAGFKPFVFNENSPTQSMIGHYYTPTGTLQIGKKIVNEDQIKNNNCYGQVSDSVFTLFRVSDNQEIATLTIGTDGLSNKINDLEEGSYYLRETIFPTGMAKEGSGQNPNDANDKNYYPVTIEAGKDNTWYTKEENKILNYWQNDPIAMWLGKIDLETTEAMPQGSASLENAEFTIKYYDRQIHSIEELEENNALRTWIVSTNSNGFATLNEANFVSGDEYYRSSTGMITIPLGTISIQETKAPKGYLLEDTVHIRNITSDGSKLEAVETYNMPIVPEPVIKGGIELEKVDKELQELEKKGAQGNADLVGIKFAITNEGTKPVWFNNESFDKGEVVTTIETVFEDGKYVARTKIDDLSYSSYGVQEVETNGTYLLTDGIKRVVSVRNHEQYHTTDLEDLDLIFENKVARGDLYLEKWSKETNERVPTGNGTLDGAIYEITNKSEKGVIVEGVFYEPGAIVKTLETENGGIAKTTGRTFPIGSYTIEEIQAPEGYLLEGEIVRDFTITSDGEVINLGTKETAIKNESIRADLELIKVADGSQKRMANVPFKFTSKTTGESHIMLTDKNGYLNSSSEWVPHSSNTNRGESASDGIWFGAGEVNDDRGAFLYDSYIIDELPCAANEGYKLLEGIEITIDRNGVLYKLGTLTNDPEAIKIGTKFMEDITNEKTLLATGKRNLNDVVSYAGLQAGRTYQLDLIVMEKESEEPLLINEEEQKSTITFVPTSENGEVEVPIILDVSGLGGKQIVAFEKLWDITDELNPKEVASHEDIEDEGQTITLIKEPAIGTKFMEVKTGDKEVVGDGERSFEDVVAYENLELGKNYELRLSIWDDEKEEFLLDEEGEVLTSVLEFTLADKDKNSGSVNVPIDINVADFQGQDLVAYEELWDVTNPEEPKYVAEHKDPDAKEQTITIRPEDPKTEVEIIKADQDTKEKLKGAILSLTNGEGELVREWTSSDEVGEKFFDLIPGEYTLKEISAPDNYELAPDMKIIVKDVKECQMFTMYDKQKSTKPDGDTKALTNRVNTGDRGLPMALVISIMVSFIFAVLILVRRKG